MSPSPRLLAINNYFYRRGGAEAVFFDHMDIFSDAGWDVVPFAMQHPDNQASPWAPFFVSEIEYGRASGLLTKMNQAAKIVFSMEARRKIDAIVARARPTVAHAHNVYHHLSPSIFGALKAADVPVVMTVHDLKLACPAYKMLRQGRICEACHGGRIHNVLRHRCVKDSLALSGLVFLETLVHRSLGLYRDTLARLITPSRFYRDKLIAWGWDPEQISYIPNCIEASRFAPSATIGDYFVFAGRLAPEKGLATLIEASALSGQRVVLAGAGPEEASLRQLAADLDANVVFAGRLDGAALHKTVGEAKALILPSEWYENAPISILEAYALGRPVIGADIGGIPEMVRPGETGVLFPSGDAQALAEAMLAMAARPAASRAGIGAAGRAWVETAFSPAAYRDGNAGPLPGDRSLPLIGAADRSVRVAILGLRGIPDVQGGVETHVAHLAPRLARHGLQVEVIGRSPYLPVASRVWNGVTITPVWSPRSKALEAIVHTAVGLLTLARRPPDIIHIHAIGPALLAPLARLLGARIVVTHHGFDYDRQKWGSFAKAVLRLGEHLGMRFAHARIGVSAAIATAVHERYDLPTTFIPNGVAIVPPREGLSMLAPLGLAPRRYILMVARIVEEKRQTDLIAAFARLGDPGLTLVIAGGSEHAGRYLEAVQAAAQAVPNVRLVGVQTGETLAQLYANAALFVLPSSHEGMPIALLEALGYGLPVLASDIAANLALDLGPDAYVPLGDTDALAGAMRAKLAVPHDEQRAEAQRIAIATRYGWDLVAGQTIAVYEAAMSSSRETKRRRGAAALPGVDL